MTSQVEVCNRALIKLGAGRITNITDSIKPAQVMAALWDSTRRSELAQRYWTFAMSRVLLPKLATAPAFGFANAFQLPVDYLKLAQIGDQYIAPGLAEYRTQDDSAWMIEGRVILTDFNAPM
ncbi:hypothetical protein [Ralstonia pseudosolanacearum]|uniref:hypothetical protein n=1 Tax=Ralstonia pseudosolanacearum TaxID=1310165 RepID=UPI001FF77252|nr:hypothetical protein [Ralstonia pseudosolanacearum]